jgi:hypothetical protein
MGGFAMAIAPALDLPWHSPPRVLATMVMGRSALANILQFKFIPFAVGVVVLVVLTVALGLVFAALVRARQRVRILLAGFLFALAGWAVLQYFLLPVLFPLVTDKGFTPKWYAVTFGVYGLTLGALMAMVQLGGPQAAPAGAPPMGPPPPSSTWSPPPPQPPAGPGPGPGTQTPDEWSERMRQLRGG